LTDRLTDHGKRALQDQALSTEVDVESFMLSHSVARKTKLGGRTKKTSKVGIGGGSDKLGIGCATGSDNVGDTGGDVVMPAATIAGTRSIVVVVLFTVLYF